jgi:hypothetical protein
MFISNCGKNYALFLNFVNIRSMETNKRVITLH